MANGDNRVLPMKLNIEGHPEDMDHALAMLAAGGPVAMPSAAPPIAPSTALGMVPQAQAQEAAGYGPFELPSTVPGRPGRSALGKFGHALGVVGQVAGSALVPHVMPWVPGTEQYRERQQLYQQGLQTQEDINKLREAEAKQGTAEAEHLGALTGAMPQEPAYYKEGGAVSKTGAELPGALPEAAIARAVTPTGDKKVAQFTDDQGREMIVFQKPSNELYSVPAGVAGTKPSTSFQEETYQDWKKTHPDGTREQFTEEKEQRAADRQAKAQARAFGQQEAMLERRNQMLTNSTKTMIEAAPKVDKFVDQAEASIRQIRNQLGPGAGRWNEFWTGRIGTKNPQFAQLRTTVGLLQTLLMRMHVGARGGEYIMKHFQDLIDAGKQDPDNMLAALETIRQYASDLMEEGKSAGMGAGAQRIGGGRAAPSAPEGQPVYQDGKIIGYTTDGKTMTPVK